MKWLLLISATVFIQPKVSSIRFFLHWLSFDLSTDRPSIEPRCLATTDPGAERPDFVLTQVMDEIPYSIALVRLMVLG